FIDRRLNDRRKSAVNRQRFIQRYKDHLRRAVSDIVAKRSIRDLESGGQVQIPVRDISEPAFRHGPGGDREIVHPGNRIFKPGDRIPRPEDGEGDGPGSQAGEGEVLDSFAFTLSREEFLELFLDDLELPRMERTVLGSIKDKRTQPAGFTRSGSPRNLHILRSLKQSLARRMAARGANALESGEARPRRVPFLDEVDLRYRHRVTVPKPVSQAVMFCLMDVSGSMTEDKKDLAKRFFALLYLFLTRKYETVDLVFVRHTDNASEVDEEEFFYGNYSGGTVVLSALELMKEIVDQRYPPTLWNIYGAQASDGDAFGADPEKSRGFLEKELLPAARYFAYIDIPTEGLEQTSTLWQAYQRIDQPHFAMKRVSKRSDIYPVFRELFRKETAAA
ncbi:MAG: YeaH/YhbH family protein, partial [Burkholderiales bacterium]|nr:YeaH/YhbH family protein [Burkholderiales bacterium]